MSDSETPGRSSRTWFIIATVVIAVLVVASGALVSSLVSASGSEEKPQKSAAPPADEERPLPENQPGPTLAGPNPATCEELYSPEMMTQLTNTGLPLNDPSMADSVGTGDGELQTLISQAPQHLECSWGYAGDYGLTTSVVRLDDAGVQAVRDRMDAAGFSCSEEDQGTRCLTSFTEGGTRYGESHFLREGVWLATKWVNFAPSGYTPDMIDTLWPYDAAE